jgi:hypothetical protein
MITYITGVITSSLRLTTAMSPGGSLTLKQKLVDVADGRWQLNGIPCPHAICAIYRNKRYPEEYISKNLLCKL